MMLAATAPIVWSTEADAEWQIIKGSEGLSGKASMPVFLNEKTHWLVSSEEKGLLLLDGSGKLLSSLKGPYELVDMRKDVQIGNTAQAVAVTLDYERNRLVLASLNQTTGKLQKLAELPTPNYGIDGLCLYQGLQDHLYAFVLDGRGIGEQWLLIDGTRNVVDPQLVRSLKVPPNSSFCSVDDSTDMLYVSEENLGVWAYGAQPEASLDRHLIQVVQPHGEAENVAGVSAFPGGLITVDPDAGQLRQFTLDGDQVISISTIKLQGLEEAESVSIQFTDDSAWVAVFDDGQDKSYSKQLELKQVDTEQVDTKIVLPTVQTPPMVRSGDVADDPAIWVNPEDPESSLVFGTNKKEGLHIYDLQGNELQFFAAGRLNNVDVRHGFKFNEKQIDIAAASNRTEDSISLFGIDPKTAKVSNLGSVPTSMEKVYGACMYKAGEDDLYVFINNKDGLYHQYQILADGNRLTSKLVREFKVSTQPEGCVANELTGELFVGEEEVGIWVIGADANSGTELKPVISVGDEIQADVEGLGFYHGKNSSYLVASSQGSDSYVILDSTAPYKVRGVFRVGLNVSEGIDGSSETDGLDVTSFNLGGAFSEGMLVVQDGRNVMPSSAQNFKYIPWSSIRQALNLK